jgi:predicted RNA binding protein YcfA (HicA-like mRNA interferase family)
MLLLCAGFIPFLCNFVYTQNLFESSVFATYLCPMTVRDLLKILRKDGWLDKEQKGSHLQLIHPKKKGKVTVPVHGGDIPKGTLNAILKQAGIK